MYITHCYELNNHNFYLLFVFLLIARFVQIHKGQRHSYTDGIVHDEHVESLLSDLEQSGFNRITAERYRDMNRQSPNTHRKQHYEKHSSKVFKETVTETGQFVTSMIEACLPGHKDENSHYQQSQAAQTHVAREGWNVIYITYVTRWCRVTGDRWKYKRHCMGNILLRSANAK